MAKKEGRLKKAIQRIYRIQHFLTIEIWSTHLEDYPPKLKSFIKYLRVVLLALRGFNEDKVTTKASALTYYTLMSIVPVFAMLFGIAKGFGFDKYLEQQIIENFKGQEEVMNKVINFSNSLLARTGGGLIAGVGVVLLFWSVMKLLNSIEKSFNEIWQVPKPRSYARMFSDYLSMMLLAPILLIASSSMNVFLVTQLDTISKQMEIIGYMSPYIMFLLNFIPYLLLWTLFSIVYIVMPNTKVSFKSGIIAGIIAGSAFAVTQWLYIEFQVGVSRNNAIYGSFAALPLFLIWLQTSWLIVLFGAEIAFANQNVEMYEFEDESEQISPNARRTLSLLIMSHVTKRFVAGETPQTAIELSKTLHIPLRLMRGLLYSLVRCRLLSEVYTKEPMIPAYQPAQYVDRFTVSFVLNAIDNLGHNLQPNLPEMDRIVGIHQKFVDRLKDLPENIYVKDI